MTRNDVMKRAVMSIRRVEPARLNRWRVSWRSCLRMQHKPSTATQVRDERTPGFAVLAAPLDVGEVDAIVLDQETSAAISERLDVR